MSQIAEHKLSYAIIAIGQRMPYLNGLLMTLVFRSTTRVKTIAVNKHAVIFYNAEFIESLPLKKVIGCVLHEVLHILYYHFDRRVNGGFEPGLFNIAADVALNQDIDVMVNISPATNTLQEIELPDEAIRCQSFRPPLPANLTAEEYYQLLKKPEVNKQATKLKKGVASGDCGSGAGNESNELDDIDPGANEAVPQTRISQAIASTILEISQNSKLYGALPLGSVLFIKEQLKPPKINWKRVLKNKLISLTRKVSGYTDFSYRRPSRKQSVMGYKNGSPILLGMNAYQAEYLVVIDTSGSMSSSLIDAVSEISKLLRQKTVSIDFATCDTELYFKGRIANIRDVLHSLKGGGGTDMSPIFDYLNTKKKRYEAVIVITDGALPPPKNQSNATNVIWVIIDGTDPGFKGSVLQINTKDEN